MANLVDQNLAATARDRAQASLAEISNQCFQRLAEHVTKMNKLARAESVNVDLRKFVPNVREQVQVPLLVELRVMAALHQDLRATERDRLLDFLVDLVEGDHVRVVLFFRPPKRAELAVHVADVGVVYIAIDVVGGDLIAAPVVGIGLGQAAAAIRQRAQLRQRQLVQPRRLVAAHAFAIPNFLA